MTPPSPARAPSNAGSRVLRQRCGSPKACPAGRQRRAACRTGTTWLAGGNLPAFDDGGAERRAAAGIEDNGRFFHLSESDPNCFDDTRIAFQFTW